MSERRLWPLAAFVFGLITLGVFIGFNLLPSVQAAYAPGALPAAISAFQRAETMADLILQFGIPADPAKLAAMDAVNRLDLYAFIPAYTLFLAAGALMLNGARAPLAWLAIAFVLAGAAADVVETRAQLRITADFTNAAAHLPIANWHWFKYAALASGSLSIGMLALLQGRRILGLISLAPLPLVMLAYEGGLAPRAFSAAFAAAWLALFVAAIKDVLAKPAPGA